MGTCAASFWERSANKGRLETCNILERRQYPKLTELIWRSADKADCWCLPIPRTHREFSSLQTRNWCFFQSSGRAAPLGPGQLKQREVVLIKIWVWESETPSSTNHQATVNLQPFQPQGQVRSTVLLGDGFRNSYSPAISCPCCQEGCFYSYLSFLLQKAMQTDPLLPSFENKAAYISVSAQEQRSPVCQVSWHCCRRGAWFSIARWYFTINKARGHYSASISHPTTNHSPQVPGFRGMAASADVWKWGKGQS